MKKYRILIVDDSSMDRAILKSILEHNHFDVVELEGGEECMTLIPELKPDAILLDSVMPHPSGNDILASIRKIYSAVELPVLMTTIKSESADVVEALSLGANDYITKPIDFAVALRRIQTHLMIAELSRELVKLKEREAIGSMVATYNHEINNPLMIAIGSLERLQSDFQAHADVKKTKTFETAQRSLWRVSEIVKKIQSVSEDADIRFENYARNSKVLKIK